MLKKLRNLFKPKVEIVKEYHTIFVGNTEGYAVASETAHFAVVEKSGIVRIVGRSPAEIYAPGEDHEKIAGSGERVIKSFYLSMEGEYQIYSAPDNGLPPMATSSSLPAVPESGVIRGSDGMLRKKMSDGSWVIA